MVTDPSRLAPMAEDLIRQAKSGHRGAVVLHVPGDLFAARVPTLEPQPLKLARPGPTVPADVADIAKHLSAAMCSVTFAGGGFKLGGRTPQRLHLLQKSLRLRSRTRPDTPTLCAIASPDVPAKQDPVAIQSTAADRIAHHAPMSLITPLDFGMVGFGFAAAIGAKAAVPERLAVAIMGDGAIGKTVPEIQTTIVHDLPVTIVVLAIENWAPSRTSTEISLRTLAGRRNQFPALLQKHRPLRRPRQLGQRARRNGPACIRQSVPKKKL